jgi:hypothetical protein
MHGHIATAIDHNPRLVPASPMESRYAAAKDASVRVDGWFPGTTSGDTDRHIDQAVRSRILDG